MFSRETELFVTKISDLVILMSFSEESMNVF